MSGFSPANPVPLSVMNALSPPEATERFRWACGSHRWAARMAAGRPYEGTDRLHAAAEAAADAMNREDWLEAFSHHPRIGDSRPTDPRLSATSAMSSREQSGMAGADARTRAEFVRLNEEHERRFGHVFLICATGRSAGDMLEQLRERLLGTPESEFAAAVREQRKITRLRLDKMFYADQP